MLDKLSTDIVDGLVFFYFEAMKESYFVNYQISGGTYYNET